MAYFDFSGFEISINRYIKYVLGKRIEHATKNDMFNAVSVAVRKYLIDIRLDTEERYQKNDSKRLFYLSMEFLTGRLLSNNLLNLEIYDKCNAFVKSLGWELDELVEEEHDPALGNGGLGRLAACFLDSLATMHMPGFGYGINYDYGLFKQKIENGYQIEEPDYWPNRSSPWLVGRSDKYVIPIYGKIVDTKDKHGSYNPMWADWTLIFGRAHDVLVAGYGGKTVNWLRLFSAWASEKFDIQIFNDGDYFKAVEEKIKSEKISKILYPSDSKEFGKELRLVQEYFLVACSVQDIISIYLKNHDNFEEFHEKVAIQLNDTHPALTVAELMRKLIDQYGLEWNKAWEITNKTLGYTNHTLLPEALEKWPLSIMERVIPRHLQIIYEINKCFLSKVKKKYPGDVQILKRMSIIEEGDVKKVRMANLAIIGSHSVNGVAQIHSQLVKEKLVPDFYKFFPEKFNNKTNGVTPRRWILAANRGLADLITDAIGKRWMYDLQRNTEIECYKHDSGFLHKLEKVKKDNKIKLARVIKDICNINVNVDSIFDVHIKRIHEYKRQMLNVMNIIHMYIRIKEDNIEPENPRTFIFSGKAAPGYFTAKLIIKLIHNIAEVINNDPDVNEWIKVVFIPDYKVSLAEKIIPAADVSEQISTAGMEASGTGNMKLAMNGAITIGTLDGANIEIYQEVGESNIYIFGLDVKGVENKRHNYNPEQYLQKVPELRRVLIVLNSDYFCKSEPGIFQPLYDNFMVHGDYYLHMADFESYIEAQANISKDFSFRVDWTVKSLINISRTSKFSSDRTIKEYADDIWGIKPFQ